MRIFLDEINNTESEHDSDLRHDIYTVTKSQCINPLHHFLLRQNDVVALLLVLSLSSRAHILLKRGVGNFETAKSPKPNP